MNAGYIHFITDKACNQSSFLIRKPQEGYPENQPLKQINEETEDRPLSPYVLSQSLSLNLHRNLREHTVLGIHVNNTCSLSDRLDLSA